MLFLDPTEIILYLLVDQVDRALPFKITDCLVDCLGHQLTEDSSSSRQYGGREDVGQSADFGFDTAGWLCNEYVESAPRILPWSEHQKAHPGRPSAALVFTSTASFLILSKTAPLIIFAVVGNRGAWTER